MAMGWSSALILCFMSILVLTLGLDKHKVEDGAVYVDSDSDADVDVYGDGDAAAAHTHTHHTAAARTLVLAVRAAAIGVTHASKTTAEKKINQLAKLSTMMVASSLLQEVEEMGRSGEDPAFDQVNEIKRLIDDTLIPDLKATRQFAADTILANLEAIETCNSVKVTKNDQIQETTEAAVSKARSNHTTCRADEKIKHEYNLTSASSCGVLGTFLATFNDPVILPTTRDDMVQYARDLSDTNVCKDSEVITLNSACTDAEAELTTLKADCASKQATFESDFCSWEGLLVLSCNTHAECYRQSVKAYEATVSETTVLVEKWKHEWKALQMIRCYTDVWLSDGNASTVNGSTAAKCESMDPPTTSMDVDYGAPAAEAGCSVASVVNYPGTDAFMTAEYADIHAFVEPAIACVSPAPAHLVIPGSLELWYLGCFLDDDSRMFPNCQLQQPGRDVPTDTCAKEAAEQNMTHIGLQFRGVCFCGMLDMMTSRYTKKPDSDCGEPNAEGVRMGGSYTNAVYEFKLLQ